MIENEHYIITDMRFTCCGEQQFKHICKHCDEPMDCYFCGFDYTERHDCDMMYL